MGPVRWRAGQLSAPEYTERLLAWAAEALRTATATAATTDTSDVIHALFRRLFRVFAHLYSAHLEGMAMLDAVPIVDVRFKHFLLFAMEFDLIGVDQLLPFRDMLLAVLNVDISSGVARIGAPPQLVRSSLHPPSSPPPVDVDTNRRSATSPGPGPLRAVPGESNYFGLPLDAALQADAAIRKRSGEDGTGAVENVPFILRACIDSLEEHGGSWPRARGHMRWRGLAADAQPARGAAQVSGKKGYFAYPQSRARCNHSRPHWIAIRPASICRPRNG